MKRLAFSAYLTAADFGMVSAHHSETVELEARKRSICSRLMLTRCGSFALTMGVFKPSRDGDEESIR